MLTCPNDSYQVIKVFPPFLSTGIILLNLHRPAGQTTASITVILNHFNSLNPLDNIPMICMGDWNADRSLVMKVANDLNIELFHPLSSFKTRHDNKGHFTSAIDFAIYNKAAADLGTWSHRRLLEDTPLSDHTPYILTCKLAQNAELKPDLWVNGGLILTRDQSRTLTNYAEDPAWCAVQVVQNIDVNVLGKRLDETMIEVGKKAGVHRSGGSRVTGRPKPRRLKGKMRKLATKANKFWNRLLNLQNIPDSNIPGSTYDQILKVWGEYKTARNKLKSLLKKSQCDEKKKEAIQMSLTFCSSASKQFWNWVKQQKNTQSICEKARTTPVLNDQGILCVRGDENKAAWAEHAKRSFTNTHCKSDAFYKSKLHGDRGPSLDKLNVTISWQEFISAIEKADNGASGAVNGIPAPWLKLISDHEAKRIIVMSKSKIGDAVPPRSPMGLLVFDALSHFFTTGSPPG